MINNHFAEVIESSLTGWVGQSWQWDNFPPFGSLVQIVQNKKILFGLVYQVQTGSMDPMRYPFPYQKTEEALLAEQPQIFEFLKTSFSCLTIGYQEAGKYYYQLAPHPAKIHGFIGILEKDLIKIFLHTDTYLHLIFGFSSLVGNVDELLLALLKQLKELNVLTEQRIERFMENYILLSGNDYRRTKLFLQRVEQLLL